MRQNLQKVISCVLASAMAVLSFNSSIMYNESFSAAKAAVNAENFKSSQDDFKKDGTKTVMLGDVNNDGVLDNNDTQEILKEFCHYEKNRYGDKSHYLDDQALMAADVNKDGNVDTIDAFLILQYYELNKNVEMESFADYLEKSNNKSSVYYKDNQYAGNKDSSGKFIIYSCDSGPDSGIVVDKSDAGKYVELMLCLENPEPYNMMGCHLFYDKRLQGSAILTDGRDPYTTSVSEAAFVTDALTSSEEWSSAFYTACFTEEKTSTRLFNIKFKIPSDAKPGDVFPIDLRYEDGDIVMNRAFDEKGIRAQDSLFTNGVYGEKKKYEIKSEDIDKCSSLRNFDSTWDGYIAIADTEPSEIVTTTETVTLTSTTTTTAMAKETATITTKATTSTAKITTTTTKTSTSTSKKTTTTTTKKTTSSLTTSTSNISKKKVYAEIETADGFYYNTEKSFDKSQVRRAILHIINDKGIEKTINITNMIGFGNATPANTYYKNNRTFTYKITSIFEGDSIIDENGDIIIAKGDVLKDKDNNTITINVYIGVKGDTDLNDEVNVKDAEATLFYYAEIYSPSKSSEIKLSPNDFLVPDAQSKMDDFAAFLTDVVPDYISNDRWSHKEGRVIDIKDAESIFEFYSIASTENYSEISYINPDEIWNIIAEKRMMQIITQHQMKYYLTKEWKILLIQK